MSAGSVKVNIKWVNGKQEFKGVEMHLDQDATLFKSQVFALTNVLPERQKIMFKGKPLGETWDKFPVSQLKDGVQLTLMGSSEELVAEPAAKIVFEEDLTAMERSRLIPAAHPPGLPNAATNTCYFNSTVQMLTSIPELRASLIDYAKTDGANPFLVQLARLLFALEKRNSPHISALLCWTELRKHFPQFDEKTEDGRWQQHDAEECLSSILYTADTKLNPLPTDSPVFGASAVQQLFSVIMETQTRCVDDPSEPVQASEEQVLKLKCHIDAKTSFLIEGLKNSLVEQFEKKSPSTGIDRLYESHKKISRLPKYLMVHFIRFLWKRQADTKAKILRPVDFPDHLDLFELCTPAYQERLSFKRQIDDNNSEIRSGLAKGTDIEAIAAKSAAGTPLIIDPFECDSGLYELCAVVTHQGRTADGGHYVCWVRNEDNDNWLLFDDEQVSDQLPAQIRKLVGHGGADWHIAYLTLYRAKKIVPIEVPQNNQPTPVSDD